jgi:tetratricopeptide (TPR) repeat protein
MKRKFEELRENLDEFVDQNDYPMLVVGCLSDELPYVVKFLQSLDEKHPEAFFAIFPQPFVSASGYLDAIVASLRVQLEAAGPLRAERGEPPFPPVPAELADYRCPPDQRLFAVLRYLRSLLPNENEHSVVIGLLPLECQDYPGYLKLMSSIMPIPDVKPWMAALRIVTYDDRSQRLMLKVLASNNAEHVLTFEVDFSTPALTDALNREAADTSSPVPERMACLMQLAALDYSYKRYPEAIEKYGVLYSYYEAQGIPSMQALCVLGVGDTLHAAGQLPAAKQVLQRGIALAMEHKQLAPLLNLLISATDVSLDSGQHADAESYADSGTRVAAGVLNPFAYADLHEKKGDAQVAQGKYAEGMASYKRCQELCEMYEYFHRWKSVLAKQIRWYDAAHMGRERADAEHALLLVEERERRGGILAIKQAAATPEAGLQQQRVAR